MTHQKTLSSLKAVVPILLFGLKTAQAAQQPRPAELSWLGLYDDQGEALASPQEQQSVNASFRLVESGANFPLPLSELAGLAGQWLHLYLFDAGLGRLTHLHPRPLGTNENAPADFEFAHTFGGTGQYHVWAVYGFRDGSIGKSWSTLRVTGASTAPQPPQGLTPSFYAEDRGSTVRLNVRRATVLGLEFGRTDSSQPPELANLEASAAQIAMTSLDGRNLWLVDAHWTGPGRAEWALPSGMPVGDYRIWVQWVDAQKPRQGALALRLVRK